MNNSFLEFNRSLSPLNMLLTISPYEPDKVLLTRNLSFRIDSIEVKNKAIAWYELGEALESGGNGAGAKEAYGRAIRTNGKLIPAYKALGYMELKAFKENDPDARKRALKHLGVARRLLGNRPDPTLDDWIDQLQ